MKVHATSQQISSSGSVLLDLWVVNGLEEALTEAKIFLLAPATLRWAKTDCAAATVEPIDLGPLSAKAVAHRRLLLCASERLVEGPYILGFAVEYGWGEGAKAIEVATLSMRLLLFPAQAALGAPLAMAALILPGLCFLATLRLLKFPRIEALGGTESTVAAVAISIALAAVPGHHVSALAQQAVSPGILVRLMAAAALLGLLFSGLVTIARRTLSSFRERFTVTATDSREKMLERAIKAHGTAVNETRVELAGGACYVGSHALSVDGEKIVVLGWFQLCSPPSAAAPTGRKELLMGLATGRLTPFDTVKKIGQGGSEEDTQQFLVYEEASQLVGITRLQQSSKRPPAVAFKNS